MVRAENTTWELEHLTDDRLRYAGHLIIHDMAATEFDDRAQTALVNRVTLSAAADIQEARFNIDEASGALEISAKFASGIPAEALHELSSAALESLVKTGVDPECLFLRAAYLAPTLLLDPELETGESDPYFGLVCEQYAQTDPLPTYELDEIDEPKFTDAMYIFYQARNSFIEEDL